MDEFQNLLNKSYRFLSYRPRSEKEVRDYLNKKSSIAKRPTRSRAQDLVGQSEKQEAENTKLINSVIDKLKEHKFLDDMEFTKLWIQHRKRKGIRLIMFELKQKGINKELIETVINDTGSLIVSDFDKALELAQKRIEKYKKLKRQKIYEKLGRFLVSKGFDFDVIKKVIDQVLPK